MTIWNNSSYLDLSTGCLTDASTPEAAYGIVSPRTFTGQITIGLILPRLEDPTSLLSSSYAEREAVLNGLTADQVGASFGSSQALYDELKTYLSGGNRRLPGGPHSARDQRVIANDLGQLHVPGLPDLVR